MSQKLSSTGRQTGDSALLPPKRFTKNFENITRGKGILKKVQDDVTYSKSSQSEPCPGDVRFITRIR